MINMKNILCILLLIISVEFCLSTVSDTDSHIPRTVNSSNEHLRTWISEESVPVLSQYVQTSSDYIPNIKVLLAKYYPQNAETNFHARNSYFTVPYSNHKMPAYQHPEYIHRSSLYPDHHAMYSIPDHDIMPLKKHDYGGEGQNYGGWDTFPGLGPGSSLLQIGQAVKKGKEAKALFILMAPLMLLAVFGPLLATQAMIPWIANGGLSSVSTIAGSGKRKKRTLRDPRQMAELEKRLQLFLAIQDFIAKTGSTDFAEEMGEAFLRCPKYIERRNKCLERISCEYTDETSPLDPAERRIAKMVLQNVMSNPMITASIKGRLSKGFTFGKNQNGRCKNYWCEALDGPKRSVNHT